MSDKAFYEALFSDPVARNSIKTVEECQEIIDDMEERIDHGDMSACYDWLVARRNRLREGEGT